jgi:phospholipid-binding lipoprotein MlaA|tara:strand:+ start:44 stop:823 length:780 start_codon:yes stop_codon:yes gene_type:complete
MSRIFKVIILSLLIATSSMAGSDGQNDLSKNTNGEIKDCFEKVNRGIFAFNQAIDGLIFEPLAKGYLYLPSPIRSGTSNFVGNLSTLLTIPNNVLQGDFGIAGKNTLRFVVNSTVGIVGLFDPASAIGLNSYEKEDFGQTLGSWGVGEGCYVVLPVLGPSTARDAIGSLGNYMGGDAWYNVTVRNDTHYFSDFDYYATKGAGGVDFRAKNFDDINNLEENSIDFYASVKSLYLQDRRKRILNASGATQTQDDSDWEEID